MNDLLIPLAVFLLLNLLATLLRVLRGPTPADRLLAALMSGSIGVALLLLLARITGEPALTVCALLVALLAAISGAAFAQRAWHQDRERHDA